MHARSIDRRQFLATASAVALAPRLMTNRRLPPSETITLGVIGLGIRARSIWNGYLKAGARVRVLETCDVDTTRREAYKAAVDEDYGTAG